MSKTVKNILKIIGLLLLAAFVCLLIFLGRMAKLSIAASGLTPDIKLLTAEPELKTVSARVTGSGTIGSENSEALTIPGNIEITGYAVRNSETVEAGGLIANVSRTDVMLAIQELQALMDKLDAEINSAGNTDPVWHYKASVTGTIKAIYAEEGENVADCMYDHGCLGIIEVEDGVEVKMTAYAGKIDTILLEEGHHVDEGRSIFALSSADYNGVRNELLDIRQELENKMGQLYEIYRKNGVYAETAGIITGIPDDAEYQPYAIQQALPGHFDVPTTQSVSVGVKTIKGQDGWYLDFSKAMPGAEEIIRAALDMKTGDIPVSALGAMTDAYTGLPANPATFTENTRPIISYIETENKETGDPEYTVCGVICSTPIIGIIPIPIFPSVTASTQSSYEFAETTVCTFTPANKAYIDINVDELDILSLSVGQTAQISLDALKGKSFSGKVYSIGRKGTNAGGTSKFTVTVEMDRTEEMITGMNAGVSITVSETADVPCLPSEAITELDGKSIVYTGYDEKEDMLILPLEVTTGVSDGTVTQIVSGLPDNTPVYYKYASSFTFG